MPANPTRIAQTASEAKKQHKKNGPRLPERQQKQFERAFELDQRAERLREAEERRKAAKKKREEREEKTARARKQIGVGLATQLVGYSHTQAQLKSGMEAFLGVKKRKEEEQRKREMELTKKLEAIAEDMEKEPWDDDEADDIALELPELNTSFGEQWVDDDLDDDSLLEAHDLVMSDPVEETPETAAQPPPALVASVTAISPKQVLAKDDPDFTRTHGPVNKAIEAALDKLPEPLIELLSLDISTRVPHWDPLPGLLHKLNPVGLPPHRLRIKVGCIVTLLRDLNTSSQLSKSQHLRVLRAENYRLECLVLDGQLEGTKTLLTRVPFSAKYKNQEQYPFQRTQFPIRVATDYTPSRLPRDTSQSGFKLPSIPGHVRSSNVVKRPSPPIAKVKPQTTTNTSFKMPGLPASKSGSSAPPQPITTPKPTPLICPPPIDSWDDFLESGTQIARKLSADVPAPVDPRKTDVVASPSIANSLPPLSTQDFNFSLEDLEDGTEPLATTPVPARAAQPPTKRKHPLPPARTATAHQKPIGITTFTKSSMDPPPGAMPVKAASSTKSALMPLQQPDETTPLTKSPMPPPFRKPPSVSDRPGLKRKTRTAPQKEVTPPFKRQVLQTSRPLPQLKPADVTKSFDSFSDFVLSTQDAASFFEDDDNLSFGSPPIPV